MACSSSSAGSASSDVSSHENDGNEHQSGAVEQDAANTAPDQVSRGLEGILDVASESRLPFPLQANRIGTLVAAGSQVAGHGAMPMSAHKCLPMRRRCDLSLMAQ